MIRTLNWFEGIGGFRYGLERAAEAVQEGTDKTGRDSADNIPISTGEEQRQQYHYRCVGACEIDRYARSVYAHNFGHEPEWGDSLTVDAGLLPDHDLFTAGFPCQSFSVAGKREGFGDVRGTLFFEICRIIGAKRPAYILLENVKGLLSAPYTETVQEWTDQDFDSGTGEPTSRGEINHKGIPGTKGWVFLTILDTLWQLGYDCQWEVFNSRYFGVPQNRERVFIIGHLRGTPRPQVFPLGEGDGVGVEGQWAYAVDTSIGKGLRGQRRRSIVAMTAYGNSNRKDSRVQETDTYPCLDGSIPYAVGDKTVIQAGHRTKGKPRFYEDEVPAITQDYGTGGQNVAMVTTNAVDHTGFLLGPHRKAEQSMSSRLLRRLTPKECERLQGFPDDWTRWGLKDGQPVEISDTQRYKMCGNAVTTNVITAIGERILQEIQEAL